MAMPKSLCLLRLSAIGDVCHAVAMVQHIQRHWPETKITWVIGKIEANLLAGLPGVEFVIFDKKQVYRALKTYVPLLKVKNSMSYYTCKWHFERV